MQQRPKLPYLTIDEANSCSFNNKSSFKGLNLYGLARRYKLGGLIIAGGFLWNSYFDINDDNSDIDVYLWLKLGN